MRVLITGTPGTGKTSIREELSQRGYTTFEGNVLAEKAEAFVDDTDTKSAAKYPVKIVDEDILAEWIEDNINPSDDEIVFISTHLEGMIDETLFDKAVCLVTPLNVLRKRLEQRGYPEEKIMDNITSQAMEEHRINCEYTFGTVEQGKLLVLDTADMDIGQCAEAIIGFVTQNEKRN